MCRVLTCSAGHSWRKSARTSSAEEEPRCPVCGAVALAAATDCSPDSSQIDGAPFDDAPFDDALFDDALFDDGPFDDGPFDDGPLPPMPKPLPIGIEDIMGKLAPPGERLLPPAIPGYEILALLGQGGMGVVFKARQLTLDRLVALKVIRGEYLSDGAAVERFRREARAAARLSHPGIVTVYDAGEAGGTNFLVMEYVEGADLAWLLGAHGALSAPRACDYVRQAALGLQHAHERGLVHRDVKPSNLLVTSQGLVKVLDLGLANVRAGAESLATARNLTTAQMLMGTADYLAPEQALDPHSADARADIYSLGCTLYHLLTGQPPFPGGTVAQKLLRHQQDEPTAAESIRRDLPAGLVEVQRKAMGKRPEDRYRTAAAVAEALAPFCPQSAVIPTEHASPTTGTRRVERTDVADSSRRRLLVLAAAGSVVLLALILCWRLSGLFLGPPSGSSTTLVPGSSPREIMNSVGMRLAAVPPGSFWMGASAEETNDVGLDNEIPRHLVEITKGFYLSAHEVTQGQYQAVTGDSPACLTRQMGGTPDHPVESVSWYEAVEFCEKLSSLSAEKQNGRSYRLPTEAEWEYACRAGASTAFSVGSSLTSLHANFDGRRPYPPPPIGEAGSYLARPEQVGKYPPNHFRLFDMHGNVAEWCADGFETSYYENSPKHDPRGPETSDYRVARGGAWDCHGGECRAAKRFCYSPTDRHPTLGFRVVCVVN